jgi:DUF1009 family protein
MTAHADQDQTPVAILAGNGQLPLEIGNSLKERGVPVLMICLQGEADINLDDFTHETIEWEKIGRLFKILERHQIKRITLAGGVVGRPELKLRKMDFGAIRTLPGLLSVLLAGDNSILSGVIAVFEKRGYSVCSVSELAPELLAMPGPNTTVKPNRRELERLLEGVGVTHALGPFDVGQACVVVGKRAVAVEGIEGTDGMLHRVRELRESGRLPNRKTGVLVKCTKPQQDERADLPTIGPQTVENAHRAMLCGIGIEAGKSIIIEREKTFELAKQLGIFIYGIDEDQIRSAGDR